MAKKADVLTVESQECKLDVHPWCVGGKTGATIELTDLINDYSDSVFDPFLSIDLTAEQLDKIVAFWQAKRAQSAERYQVISRPNSTGYGEYRCVVDTHNDNKLIREFCCLSDDYAFTNSNRLCRELNEKEASRVRDNVIQS